jgi:predicted amidohydrolase
MEKVTAAAVQATPVFLDREATVDKACRLIGEAAAAGAGLVVFPETFVPTYPDWVWRSTPWGTAGEWFGRLLDQAVEVPSPATEAIGAAAREGGVWVSIGVNERDPAGVSTSGRRRPGTPATCGCRPCATSPRRAGCT